MSNIEEYTKNFKFIIPEFNVATWHTEIKENFKAIDALIANFVQSQQYKGAWKQVTSYIVNDLVYISDEDSDYYGYLMRVKVNHTTTGDDFDTFLANNPTYYEVQGEMGAQVAALRAQDWAEKTDGKVVINEVPIDYSSKAYAVGGTGTETNNSKYFKEQAELARDGILLNPGFIAVSADLVGDENIKTVADNIQNVNNVGNNILSVLSVYNNLSDINVCVTNISAIIDAPNQATNAQNSAISAAQSAQLAQEAAQSITNFDLFDHKWSDHLLNDQNWLRADTFSWQDGTVYTEAYNHLVDDVTNGTSQTETISGHTIIYTLADDGHKIVSDADASAVEGLYNDTGVAWYYILDLVNHRFKLPRENPAREELIQVIRAKGNGKNIGITDGTSNYGLFSDSRNGYQTLCAATNDYDKTVATSGANSTNLTPSKGILGLTTDSTKSGIISDMTESTSVYKGKQYLYFYVGQYTQTATEQTAGLNSDLFNGKADIDLSNAAPNASASAKETIVGWGIPDYTAGVSVNYPTQADPFVAPQKGIFVAWIAIASSVNRVLYINGVQSFFTINNTSGYQDNSSITVPLNAGDSVYFDQVSGTMQELGFYPYKGV